MADETATNAGEMATLLHTMSNIILAIVELALSVAPMFLLGFLCAWSLAAGAEAKSRTPGRLRLPTQEAILVVSGLLAGAHVVLTGILSIAWNGNEWTTPFYMVVLYSIAFMWSLAGGLMVALCIVRGILVTVTGLLNSLGVREKEAKVQGEQAYTAVPTESHELEEGLAGNSEADGDASKEDTENKETAIKS